jgi:hypothetical protein
MGAKRDIWASKRRTRDTARKGCPSDSSPAALKHGTRLETAGRKATA